MTELTEAQIAAALTGTLLEMHQAEGDPTLFDQPLETLACALAPLLRRRLAQFLPAPEAGRASASAEDASEQEQAQPQDEADDPAALFPLKADLLDAARRYHEPCEVLCFSGYLGHPPPADAATEPPDPGVLVPTDENGLTVRADRRWILAEPHAPSVRVIVPVGTPREEVPELLVRMYGAVTHDHGALTPEGYGPPPPDGD